MEININLTLPQLESFSFSTVWGVLFVGYIIGSIPCGLILAKISGYGDIRKIGSGNIGATNVLRTGSKKLAFITLLCDAGKGIAAVLIIKTFFSHPPEIPEYLIYKSFILEFAGGFGAVFGHNFPFWLKFNGGKGVATSFGVLFALSWPAGLMAVITWLFIALVFRFSSLAAITSFILLPIYALFAQGLFFSIASCALSTLVILRHKSNIYRLFTDSEPQISFKSKKTTE